MYQPTSDFQHVSGHASCTNMISNSLPSQTVPTFLCINLEVGKIFLTLSQIQKVNSQKDSFNVIFKYL